MSRLIQLSRFAGELLKNVFPLPICFTTGEWLSAAVLPIFPETRFNVRLPFLVGVSASYP